MFKIVSLKRTHFVLLLGLFTFISNSTNSMFRSIRALGDLQKKYRKRVQIASAERLLNWILRKITPKAEVDTGLLGNSTSRTYFPNSTGPNDFGTGIRNLNPWDYNGRFAYNFAEDAELSAFSEECDTACVSETTIVSESNEEFEGSVFFYVVNMTRYLFHIHEVSRITGPFNIPVDSEIPLNGLLGFFDTFTVGTFALIEESQIWAEFLEIPPPLDLFQISDGDFYSRPTENNTRCTFQNDDPFTNVRGNSTKTYTEVVAGFLARPEFTEN